MTSRLDALGRVCGRLAGVSERHPAVVLSVAAVVSVCAVMLLVRATLDTNLLRLYLEDAETPAQTLLAAWPVHTSHDPAVLADGLALTETLAGHPAVVRVRSLATALRLERSEPIGVKVRTWADVLATAAEPDTRALLDELRASPWLQPFVGRRGTVATLLIELDGARVADTESQTALIRWLRERISRRTGTAPDQAHLAGLIVATSAAHEVAARVLGRTLPAVTLLVLGVLTIAYRNFSRPLLIVLTAALTACWGMAAGAWIEPEVALPRLAAPVLVFLLAVSNLVFLLREFDSRRPGDAHRIVAAARRVGPAALLAALTTALSLASLVLVDAPGIRNLGITAVTGTLIGIAVQLTLVPAWLKYLPVQRRRPPPRLLRSIRRAVLLRPRPVLAALAVFGLATLACLPWLVVDTELIRRFPDDHPLPASHRFLDAHGLPAGGLTLIVSSADGGALSPALLAAVANVESELTGWSEITGVHSVASALRGLRRLLHPQIPAVAPVTEDQARQAAFFLPVAAGLLQEIIDDERAWVRSTIGLRDVGLLETAELAGRIRALVQTRLGDAARVEVGGVQVRLGEWLRELHHEQLGNFLVTCLLLAALLTWVLGSLRLGLVCLTLNVLPVAVLPAWLALTRQPFDADYLMVLFLGLGLAVDDTVHLIVQSRAAGRATGWRFAVPRAHARAGPAMLLTTAVMVFGLAPLLASGYLSLAMWSGKLTVILLAAVVIDLACLPLLIGVFSWRGGGPPAGIRGGCRFRRETR